MCIRSLRNLIPLNLHHIVPEESCYHLTWLPPPAMCIWTITMTEAIERKCAPCSLPCFLISGKLTQTSELVAAAFDLSSPDKSLSGYLIY